MANANDWRELLTQRKWMDEDGKLVASPDSLLRVTLPEGRSFVVRPGKTSPEIRISGEFLLATEHNVDSSGHSRTTAVSLDFVESIDSLS